MTHNSDKTGLGPQANLKEKGAVSLLSYYALSGAILGNKSHLETLPFESPHSLSSFLKFQDKQPSSQFTPLATFVFRRTALPSDSQWCSKSRETLLTPREEREQKGPPVTKGSVRRLGPSSCPPGGGHHSLARLLLVFAASLHTQPATEAQGQIQSVVSADSPCPGRGSGHVEDSLASEMSCRL